MCSTVLRSYTVIQTDSGVSQAVVTKAGAERGGALLFVTTEGVAWQGVVVKWQPLARCRSPVAPLAPRSPESL